MRRRAALAIVLRLAGCGYRLVHAPVDPLGPFEVVGGRVYVPDSGAIGAMAEGARAELSRAGELGSGGAAIEVELLRFDMESEGIAAGKGAAGAPLARGVRVVAVGRARMRRAGSGAVERDTGDVRASETAGLGPDTAQALATHDEAARAAARRLGEVLVRRLLGFPEPGDF
jgi:hypothetical protein